MNISKLFLFFVGTSLTASPLVWAAPQDVAQTQAAALSIVADSQPQAAIVTADKPGKTIELAARVLADHLFAISKAKVATIKESALGDVRIENGRIVAPNTPDGVQTYLLVGQSSLTKQLGITADGLGPGGIRLHAGGNAVILLGAETQHPSNPNATLYAVTTFLEDVLGVRYLWPGESGGVIPHHTTITVPRMDRQETPLLPQRRIRDYVYNSRLQSGLDRLGAQKEDYERLRAAAMATKTTSPGWFAWQRLGGSNGLVTGHAFSGLWKKYGQEHPEWFAMQPNGSRDQSKNPGRARLCESNLELQAAIARDKIEELNAKPSQTSVSIDQNDGGELTFCLCDQCKKLDPPQGRPVELWDFTSGTLKTIPYVSLTDRMVYFWNGIAERVTQVHPNALLTVRAYSVYVAPPLMRKLHPNIVVEHVSGNYLRSEADLSASLEDWNNWAKAAPRLAWRPNIPEMERNTSLPVVFVHKLAQDFRTRAHNHMTSTDIDSCHHFWATGGLNLYVLTRLLWNPDADVDQIVDDYCEKGFGPGAGSIKRYFQQIEEITNQLSVAPANVPRDFFLANSYSPATITALRAHLEAAQKASAQDAAVLKRIAFLGRGLDFADAQAQALRLLQRSQTEEKNFDRQAANQVMIERERLLNALFQHDFLAVNVPYMLWRTEERLDALRLKTEVSNSAKTIIDADDYGKPDTQQAPATR